MRRALTVLAAVTALVASLATGPAASGQARRVSTNPLVGGPWGVPHQAGGDTSWQAYEAATDPTTKELLAKIALRSRARWFTSYNPAGQMQSLVHSYVTELQQQYPGKNVLIPMALFRQFPTHESNKGVPWTPQMIQAYKDWYAGVAAGLGNARALIILEPDLAVILKDAWAPRTRESLVAYAARTLHNADPNAAIYIEAGSYDWLTVSAAATLLKRSGVGNVRGFALSGTHYDTTPNNIRHGRQIVAKLAQLGIPGKHFVIDTADNGHGFTFAQYGQHHPGSDVTNPVVCQTQTQQVCETLGIPPTWKVAEAKWHLSATVATMARRWVDGYVWYNRPWLDHNAGAFQMNRALPLARTTPFAMCTTPC
jgi:endoglucanase